MDRRLLNPPDSTKTKISKAKTFYFKKTVHPKQSYMTRKSRAPTVSTVEMKHSYSKHKSSTSVTKDTKTKHPYMGRKSYSPTANEKKKKFYLGSSKRPIPTSLPNKKGVKETKIRSPKKISSKGSSSKSKSSKGRGILEDMENCIEESDCASPNGAPSEQPKDTDSTSSKKGSQDKKDCCKGGASALFMIYRGTTPMTFYTSSAVEDLNNIDPCSNKEYRVSKNDDVVFVDCEECFPAHDLPFQVCGAEHAYGSIVVHPNDSVCLLSLNPTSGDPDLSLKLPTDTYIFYDSGTGDFKYHIPVHTSCSKPIYPPYALELEGCSSGYPLVNLEEESLVGKMYLEFVDGVSAKDPSVLFANCPMDRSRNGPPCCRGGASYLRMEHDSQSPGIMTLNATVASEFSICVEEAEYRKRRFASPSPVRFVPCNDPCLQLFANVSCQTSDETIYVMPKQDICIASIDQDSGTVMFETDLPTTIFLYFAPQYDVNGVDIYVMCIDTSCRSPIHFPYGQQFIDSCGNGHALPIDLSKQGVLGSDQTTPLVAFVDGASRDFFLAAQSLGMDENSPYDLTFAGCGCHCPNATFTPTIAPTNMVSPPPSPELTIPSFPTSRPSPAQTTPPSFVPETLEPTALLDFKETMEPTASLDLGDTMEPTAMMDIETTEPTAMLNIETTEPTAMLNIETTEPTALLEIEDTLEPTSGYDFVSTFEPTSGIDIATGVPTEIPTVSTSTCHQACIDWVHDYCSVFDTSGTLVHEHCVVPPLPPYFYGRSLGANGPHETGGAAAALLGQVDLHSLSEIVEALEKALHEIE